VSGYDVDALAGLDEVSELSSWPIDHVPEETIRLVVVAVPGDV